MSSPTAAPSCAGNANSFTCSSIYPSDFCCPTQTTCIALYNENSTVSDSTKPDGVICCPSGSDCAFIQPITCDPTLFNATLHPDNQMHLVAPFSLEKCNGYCCPIGYQCTGTFCRRTEQYKVSSSSSISFTPTSTPTATTPLSSNTSIIPAVAGDIKMIALSSAFGGTLLFALLGFGFFLMRRHGMLPKMPSNRKDERKHKLSWNKAELEATEHKIDRVVPVELDADRAVGEMRAERDLSELPG